MAWRKKLTAQKLVDFLLASLDDSNPSKRSLVDLAGGEPSPAPPPPKPATPKRRSSRGKKQTEGGDVEMADAAEGGEASATKDDTAGDNAGDGANAVPPTPPTPAQRELPETEAYSHLLVLLLLLDANDPECKAASVAALSRAMLRHCTCHRLWARARCKVERGGRRGVAHVQALDGW